MISVKFDLHKKEALWERRYFTGSVPLLTPATVLRHVCPEAFTSITIVFTCGGKFQFSIFCRHKNVLVMMIKHSQNVANVINKHTCACSCAVLFVVDQIKPILHARNIACVCT